MEQMDLLKEDELALPKYSAFGHQLLRQELLLDACFNNYTKLASSEGRAMFNSALELFYVSLAPQLTQEDRTNIKKYIIKIREISEDISNSPENYKANLATLRRLAWVVLEIMTLLKDKRGGGIPKKETITFEEELAESLDINPEDIEKFKGDTHNKKVDASKVDSNGGT